ncbi:MAG: MBL fold metallo-hydrolase [Anaerolineales bacterium]|nr:MBL fold metallo-hydrolase [Anaerolineales bacterium]
MARLIILGSGAALPDAFRDNTYMVIEGRESSILIDCGGSPLHKLQAIGVDLDTLDSLIVTHHHPDHIYGVPALLLGLWLYGRQEPFHIFGPQRSVTALTSIMDSLEWQDWPCTMPVAFHEVEMREGYRVIESPEFEITTAPVEHLIPAIAVKVMSRETGRTVVYSGDTEPCEALARLAQGADILIHESTGDYAGHSTPAQAGAMARRCGVGKLVLIHFTASGGELEGLRRAAEAEFNGPVELAEDFAVYPL